MARPLAPAVRRALTLAAVALALGLVFASYLAPDAVLGLSNRLWACFGG